MSKNTIKIDGAKLKQLLEERSGRSLYQISEDEGFSRNFLSQACRSGKASPIVQSVANKYSVRKEEYILSKEFKQMTIEEIDPNLVPREKINEAIEIGKNTVNSLRDIADNRFNEAANAFEKLAREWDKALGDYAKQLRDFKEGLK